MHLGDRRILAGYVSAWAVKLSDASIAGSPLSQRKNNSTFDAMQRVL
jgi:hypothetical protein